MTGGKDERQARKKGERGRGSRTRCRMGGAVGNGYIIIVGCLLTLLLLPILFFVLGILPHLPHDLPPRVLHLDRPSVPYSELRFCLRCVGKGTEEKNEKGNGRRMLERKSVRAVS
eukprot:1032149-Rhodomonas_salina.2